MAGYIQRIEISQENKEEIKIKIEEFRERCAYDNKVIVVHIDEGDETFESITPRRFESVCGKDLPDETLDLLPVGVKIFFTRSFIVIREAGKPECKVII